MLDIIYFALNLTGIITVLISLVFIITIMVMVKKKFNTVPNIKVQNVNISIMCLLFFFQIILGIILEKTTFSNGIDIFCLIIWLSLTILNFRSLNNLEIHIVICPVIEDEGTEEDCDTKKLM